MGKSQTSQDKLAVDREHTMQVGLLDLLGQAVADGKPRSETLEIVDQLLSFSDVHFMSEQLMMRQYGYDRYEQHVAEHDTLVAMLRDIKSSLTRDPATLESTWVVALRAQLLDHTGREDRHFAEFLQKFKQNQAP